MYTKVMVYKFDGYNYLIRLDRGESLAAALEQFAEETQIKGGWVNGLGACEQATLGFYDLDNQQYNWKDFAGLREVLSLTGNLARDEDGKFMFHLHGVLGDEQYQTVGGHVKDLKAGATLELFVHRAYQPTERRMNESVGLKTLDLS